MFFITNKKIYDKETQSLDFGMAARLKFLEFGLAARPKTLKIFLILLIFF